MERYGCVLEVSSREYVRFGRTSCVLQHDLSLDNNNCQVGINTYNFMRDLQWNNIEKEIDDIPDSVFRF